MHGYEEKENSDCEHGEDIPQDEGPDIADEEKGLKALDEVAGGDDVGDALDPKGHA